MTTAASPFSFHCMICFEEFHSEKRYPVILPCGHTYVCNVCSERLDKCMECRTPLFVWTVPSPHKPLTVPQTNSLRWSSSSSSSANPKRNVPRIAPALDPPTKTRLPLPKNVVLLSLMEATELTTERQKPASPLTTASSRKQAEEEEEEDLNLEETKIREGTSLAVSGCGTYGVTAESLLIYPIRPSAGDTQEGGDVDTLVRFHHLDQEVDKQRVSMGDRIQIVSIEGGWAKLARGYGFIQANSNQIVKVGGSMDRACILEAMLHSLSIRRKELRKEQSKVDSRFVIAMNELQASLAKDEDLTVICAETFKEAEAKEKLNMEKKATEKMRDMKMSSSLMDDDDDDDDDESDSSDEEQAAESAAMPMKTPADISLSAPIAMARQETPQYLMGSSSNSGLGCGFSTSMGLPDLAATSTTLSPSRARAASHPISPSTSFLVNPSQMSAGARAWRERHNRPASTGIDFRTGLSGHTALTSSHAHPHEYLGGRSAWRTGMSNHSGLSRTVRKTPSFPPDSESST